ncbi:SoxR reducing system RseC family protein [Mangrovitalea sediminis]|uniref:SoxR reducing system RseC family protein n=1 Tax=Mangrovitalea sediminis TaxID=1982043 RepID=UPI000BE4B58B|nr:SoxR reducing system RseC family protein [Mangrovitalea sediminis]
MLEESGRVVAIEGDRAWVAIKRQSGCQGCDVRAGCGQGALAGMGSGKIVQISVINHLNACEGDPVTIGMTESALLRVAVQVYLWPLLGMLFFAVMANLAGFADSAVAFAGLLGLGSGFVLVSWFQRRGASSGDLRPLLLRICNEP